MDTSKLSDSYVNSKVLSWTKSTLGIVYNKTNAFFNQPSCSVRDIAAQIVSYLKDAQDNFSQIDSTDISNDYITGDITNKVKVADDDIVAALGIMYQIVYQKNLPTTNFNSYSFSLNVSSSSKISNSLQLLIRHLLVTLGKLIALFYRYKLAKTDFDDIYDLLDKSLLVINTNSDIEMVVKRNIRLIGAITLLLTSNESNSDMVISDIKKLLAKELPENQQ